MRMTKNSLVLSIDAGFSKVSSGQTARSSRPLLRNFQSPMTVGAPLVGALRRRSVPRLSRRALPGPAVPEQWPADGGAVRGEGDHKGRPYESFDSGNAAGADDGQSPPVFLAGSCRRPAGVGLLRNAQECQEGTFLSPRRRRLSGALFHTNRDRDNRISPAHGRWERW